jgi:hypothetical protein
LLLAIVIITMSDYKKVILSTNYTSQRNAGSSPDPPDQNSFSY